MKYKKIRSLTMKEIQTICSRARCASCPISGSSRCPYGDCSLMDSRKNGDRLVCVPE